MATQIEAGRRLVYHALNLYVGGENPIREVAMAKLFCGQVACDVANRCLQVYGGYGYMEEYDIARVYRDVRILPIGGGTDEIMREIIARSMNLG